MFIFRICQSDTRLYVEAARSGKIDTTLIHVRPFLLFPLQTNLESKLQSSQASTFMLFVKFWLKTKF